MDQSAELGCAAKSSVMNTRHAELQSSIFFVCVNNGASMDDTAELPGMVAFVRHRNTFFFMSFFSSGTDICQITK